MTTRQIRVSAELSCDEFGICMAPMLEHACAAMSLTVINDEYRTWPVTMRFPSGDGGTGNITPSVDERSRYLPYAAHAFKQRRFTKPVVCPVVRGEPGKGQPERIVLPPRITLESDGTDRNLGVLLQRLLTRSRGASIRIC